MKGKLTQYCESKKITICHLAVLVKIGRSRLGDIDKNPKANLNVDTIDKIYNGTKEKFGDGLRPEDYIDINLHRWL